MQSIRKSKTVNEKEIKTFLNTNTVKTIFVMRHKNMDRQKDFQKRQ